MSHLPEHVDTIIVGQGLAGTMLGWTLLQRGTSILIIDQAQPYTASRVAPGLITPVTGKRLKLSWNWPSFWPVAEMTYRSLEKQLDTSVLNLRPSLRLFRTPQERSQFETQRDNGEYSGIEVRDISPHSIDGVSAPWGGFEMYPAGNLDVAAFLNVSSSRFTAAGQHWKGFISYEQIDINNRSMRLAGQTVHAQHLVFCEGWRGRDNPWFQQIDFRPAKGELLRVEIPSWEEPRTIHSGKWLSPIRTGQYWAGSTYDWKQLDSHPTETGRQAIADGLSEFLVQPAQILEHVAAVRPAVSDSRPVIGRHADFPWLYCFNGLGTKGVLQAPLMAQLMAEIIVKGHQPPADVSLCRW